MLQQVINTGSFLPWPTGSRDKRPQSSVKKKNCRRKMWKIPQSPFVILIEFISCSFASFICETFSALLLSMWAVGLLVWSEFGKVKPIVWLRFLFTRKDRHSPINQTPKYLKSLYLGQDLSFPTRRRSGKTLDLRHSYSWLMTILPLVKNMVWDLDVSIFILVASHSVANYSSESRRSQSDEVNRTTSSAKAANTWKLLTSTSHEMFLCFIWQRRLS